MYFLEYPYFFALHIKNITVIISEQSSAAEIASHTPLSPKKIGSTSTAITWHTSVLINEISAEISPLPSAVKNAEP